MGSSVLRLYYVTAQVQALVTTVGTVRAIRALTPQILALASRRKSDFLNFQPLSVGRLIIKGMRCKKNKNNKNMLGSGGGARAGHVTLVSEAEAPYRTARHSTAKYSMAQHNQIQ